MTREDIARRISEIRAVTRLSQRALAEKIGVAFRTWQSIESGKNVPSGETLLKISDLGFRPGWILTGEGEMFADATKAPAPSVALDPELMERLYKEVDRAYRDEGQKAPQHRIAHEAATLYNLLLAKLADIRETELVDAVIPVLIKDLKKRLQTAVEEPGTGKHSA